MAVDDDVEAREETDEHVGRNETQGESSGPSKFIIDPSTSIEEEITGLAMAAMMGEVGDVEPASYREAMKSLEELKTWTVVDEAPAGANVIGCRWVYVLKKDSAGNVVRHKARLVAQGFSQIPGVDYFDTYAPVAKMASIRTVLNGEFEEGEVIYMKMPPGFQLSSNPKAVLRIDRPLYGLCQAGFYWYNKLRRSLGDELAMVRCEVDHSVFVARKQDDVSIAVAHVDDLTLVTSTLELMAVMKRGLSKCFQISDMGEIHWILGFSVKRDREKRTISLSQASYINAIVKRFGFENLKLSAVPMSPGCKLSSADSPQTSREYAEMKNYPYREAIGSAQYASVGTRPDITYVVGVLSKYLEKPGLAHWEAVKTLYRYLSGTADWVLTYGDTSSELVGYSDADGSVHEDRKAVSGYAFMIDGGAVSWSSKKQEIISLSTTESEYIASTHAAKETLWLRTLISETFGDIESPTVLYGDNQSAIALTKNQQFHSRTKHIDIRFHFIRWVVEAGKIKLVYCPTDNMLADTLTKALPSSKAKHFANNLGLRSGSA